MKTYRLRVVFEPDEDGWDGWSAYCPALEDWGGMTWGQTWEKAHKEIIRTLEIVTGSMIDSGTPIPEELEETALLNENQILVAIEPKLKPPPRPAHLRKTYHFRVEMEPDEDVWFVRCPTLESHGAATWGKTKEQARRHIEEVLGMVLESMIEQGIPIPEDTTLLEGECLAVTI